MYCFFISIYNKIYFYFSLIWEKNRNIYFLVFFSFLFNFAFSPSLFYSFPFFLSHTFLSFHHFVIFYLFQFSFLPFSWLRFYPLSLSYTLLSLLSFSQYLDIPFSIFKINIYFFFLPCCNIYPVIKLGKEQKSYQPNQKINDIIF